MKVKISPSVLSGSFYAPPSKSFAHRLMLCAALASGKSHIKNISGSEDLLATADCISAIGADVIKTSDGFEILGNPSKKSEAASFFCRESGSTLRFFLPVALALCEKSFFHGSRRLISRGVDVYENIFSKKGISFVKSETAIEVSGQLTPGDYAVRGDVSSQYISGLMFALPLLDGDSRIEIIPPVESKPYIDITVDVLEKFGIKIASDGENRYFIEGNQRYLPCSIAVEGDWSNSAPFFALNALGGSIAIYGLNESSLQGDKVIKQCVEALDSIAPKIDISDCPDLSPVLFALAAAKNGAEFIGTKRLEIKESSRAAAMKEELLKLGIATDLYENRTVVRKGILSPPKIPISSHNDHRIVMAMSVLLTLTGGEIDGAEAVTKSFPDFFKVLKALKARVTYDT